MSNMKKLSFVLIFGVLAFVNVASATIMPPPNLFPTDASECKKGGWENYNGLFKNQGDCVSFVVTEGKNAPDGPSVVN